MSFRMGDAAVPSAGSIAVNTKQVAESTDADESPSSETSNEEQFVNTGRGGGSTLFSAPVFILLLSRVVSLFVVWPNLYHTVSGTLVHVSLFSLTRTLPIGLKKWEKARSQWLSHKSADCPSDPAIEQPRTAVNIDVDEIIDLIISNKWRDAPSPRRGAGSRGTKIEGCSFGQPVPLPQMIDVLLDLWEAEGLEM